MVTPRAVRATPTLVKATTMMSMAPDRPDWGRSVVAVLTPTYGGWGSIRLEQIEPKWSGLETGRIWVKAAWKVGLVVDQVRPDLGLAGFGRPNRVRAVDGQQKWAKVIAAQGC
jgi:hypothetical protein